MVKISFVAFDGTTTVIEAPEGTSVMRAATAAGIDGIVGECGGQMMCSTCHVRVDEQYLERLPEITEDEDEMLDLAACERDSTSRLSCQIPVDEKIEGVVLTLPESQI